MLNQVLMAVFNMIVLYRFSITLFLSRFLCTMYVLKCCFQTAIIDHLAVIPWVSVAPSTHIINWLYVISYAFTDYC